MVMDKLVDEVGQESPKTVTFAADIVICRKADGGIFGEEEMLAGTSFKCMCSCTSYTQRRKIFILSASEETTGK